MQGVTHLAADLPLLLGYARRVAATGISIAPQLTTDGRRRAIDQVGDPALAEALGMSNLNSGAFFKAEFGI